MDNRTNILEVALQLFADQGYEASGIQEIVRVSGVTKPTLYHYFGNKRGLLEAILETYLTGLLEKIEIAADYQSDLPATLSSIVRCMFAFSESQPVFYRLLLMMSCSSPESTPYEVSRSYFASLTKIFEKLFIAAVPQHGNMRGRHERYAFTFFGMINTYITLALAGKLELSEHSVYLLVHQFSHGIYS